LGNSSTLEATLKGLQVNGKKSEASGVPKEITIQDFDIN
jgi:hypothetical protein